MTGKSFKEALPWLMTGKGTEIANDEKEHISIKQALPWLMTRKFKKQEFPCLATGKGIKQAFSWSIARKFIKQSQVSKQSNGQDSSNKTLKKTNM